MGERALEEGGLGAEPDRLRDRHPGVDAVAPGAVRRRLYHPALIPPPAHHQELEVAQLGMALAADFDEEGVEIDVDDAGTYLDGPRAGGELR
jgi:hypothetical protein